jgi:hypothetical protein
LTTGGYLLGFFGIIDAVIMIISTGTFLSHYDEAVDTYEKKDAEIKKLAEFLVKYKAG